MGLIDEAGRNFLAVIMQVVGGIIAAVGLIIIIFGMWYWGLIIGLAGIFFIVLAITLAKRNRSRYKGHHK